jgi:hypothetical protein
MWNKNSGRKAESESRGTHVRPRKEEKTHQPSPTTTDPHAEKEKGIAQTEISPAFPFHNSFLQIPFRPKIRTENGRKNCHWLQIAGRISTCKLKKRNFYFVGFESDGQ